MSNYTKTTNFTAKDALSSGNVNKVIRGSTIDTEYDAIAVAIATKLDASGGTVTSPVLAGTMSGSGIIDGGTY